MLNCRSIWGSLRLSRGIIVPLQLMGISRKELHVAVLALHVAEGPLLGRRHPNGLSWGLGAGRLGRWTRSLWRLRGLGRRCWDGLFGRHCLRGLRLVFGAGRAASSLRGWLGDSYLVGRFHIGGRGVVAADPGGQPRPRVGSDRQHRPVEGLQGLVDPVEVLLILFLRLQKLRPVDFSELVLSLICRTRSGQGHRDSTTAWLLVQQWTW